MPSNCLCTQTGRSPLSWACESDLSEVAQLLINKGANLDIMDKVSFHNEKKIYLIQLDVQLQHMLTLKLYMYPLTVCTKTGNTPFILFL